MSEAVSQNHESGVPESLQPTPSAAPAGTEAMQSSTPVPAAEESATDEGWETVDFPGALRVDELAHDRAPEQPMPAPIAASSEAAEELTTLQRLQQENTLLRRQMTLLEQDLSQTQIELQLATAGSNPEATQVLQDSVQTFQQAQALTAAQEQIARLFHELELSHQAAQRQQILVETLTDQLESSQERIAQLERECTLTQQRYNEQVQQRLQAENTGRDLRMRLHRQQQQTLQFKAALEKCLEMPATASQSHLASPAEDQGVEAPVPSLANGHAAVPFTHKTTPVRPWSEPVGQMAPVPGLASTLFKSLSNLLDGFSSEPASSISVAQPSVSPEAASGHRIASPQPPVKTQDVSSLLQQIFPDAPPEQPYPAEDLQQAATIFDPSPFFVGTGGGQEATDAQPFQSVVVEPVTAAAIAADEELAQALAALKLEPIGAISHQGTSAAATSPSATPQPELEQSPWEESLPVPELAVATSLAAASVEVTPEATPGQDSVAIVPAYPALAQPTLPAAPSSETLLPVSDPLPPAAPSPVLTTGMSEANPISTSATQADLDALALLKQVTKKPEKAQPAEQSLKLLSVSAAGKLVQDAGTELPQTPPLFSPGFPSPVVYPLRPAKKITSMAAVDLPTFPRPQ